MTDQNFLSSESPDLKDRVNNQRVVFTFTQDDWDFIDNINLFLSKFNLSAASSVETRTISLFKKND